MPPRPSSKPRKRARRKPIEPRVSRSHAPEGMSLPAWQAALRRQFGRAQAFAMKNLGDEPLFSDFEVGNPASGGVYRVAIRGAALGDSRCTCPDFATNELGTCKHIEFALARLERRRGARTAFKRGYVPACSELWLQYGAQRSVRLRLGGDCPPLLRQQAQALFDGVDGWRLPSSRLDRLPAFIAQAADCGHELAVAPDVLGFVAEAGAAATRRHRLAGLYPQGAQSLLADNLLRAPLFRYQAEGALFAAAAGRALLADDMGLGKTVQAIAAAELWQRHFGAERVLVVCPTSLKHQWRKEIERFTGRQALIVEGLATERARRYAAPATVKIVSYDSLTRDLDLANAWRPDVLIVDEAQRIKNWDTRAARALKRLDSRHAVVLSGTPLENRLEELLSIVQLVDRHRLGPTWRFLHEHQLRDDGGRVIGYRQLDRIGETLAPIMLRRRKHEVLRQLPARRDRNLFVPLTATQQRLHQEQADNVARIVSRWRRTRHLSEADQKRLTAALQRMRMVCNSSYLVDRHSDEGHKIPALAEWMDERLADGEAKIVIFSQWLGSHELIARELDRQRVEHVLFHGGLSSRQRAAAIERFRDDPACRVFLATDAGSVGLNLQFASLLVNLDLPWNPAVLEQRIGRVFRLGQTRPVEVLNFVAENSIEENMLRVLGFKRSLFAGVLDAGAADVRLEGTRLSRFMQGVEALTGRADGVGVGEAAATPPVPTAVPAPAEDETAPRKGKAEHGAEPGAAAVPAVATAAVAGAAPAVGPAPGTNPWQPLIELGQQWLSQLAAAATSPAGSATAIERDPVSGRPCVRLPLPEPDVLRQLADALQALRRVDSG